MTDTNGEKKEPKVLLAVILKPDGRLEYRSELDVFRLNMLLDELKVLVIERAKEIAAERKDAPQDGPQLVKEPEGN